jgi:hypothetical protein
MELTSVTEDVKLYQITPLEIPTSMMTGLAIKATTSRTNNATSVLISVLHALQQITVLPASKILPMMLSQESVNAEIHTDSMACLALLAQQTHLNIQMTRQNVSVQASTD